ncbi:LlaJI family restriction endonuclease [Enterococcus hermanniensis]|uniref:R2.LlaJI n=1 Tax=Enterococcus hermanniensis TaxID=249189 RepID=A0A1L8TQG4_9ENTE|nr:LlaJI family restriction endonuclease [Enterococcus hermanniensis]OJG46314.1 R2.LlaJI [Enterococcus hermanniensis]
MTSKISIEERCHVNTNEDGDTFVGIKADTEDAVVYFPVGYQLSENETEIRRDIKNLFKVLGEYTEKKDRVLQMKKFEIAQSVDFPINAYLEVINYYLRYEYYTETENIYITSTKGKTDWSKTFKKQKPLVQQNGSFVYTQMTVKASTLNESKLITKIHKYCVYECFDKIGWLYVPNMPEQPDIEFNKSLFVNTLNDKLSNTYNDKHKALFKAMLDMIKFMDERPNEKQFYFGTDRFEYVWEKLIDRVFGESDKDRYFPKAEWKLRHGNNQDSSALQPDTIMLYKDKVYVLDAKYYRYGITGIANHLPNSSSINKQITYGEYIDKHMGVDSDQIFNAFLMPYNSKENKFHTQKIFENIGEATGKWRQGTDIKKYDRVQGIVMDVRTLMHNRVGKSANCIQQLATAIEERINS